MTDALPLRTMLTMAQDDVRSLMDFIALHRSKRTRGEAWIVQQEQILQHRRQVVVLIEREIARRQERMEDAA